MVLAVALVGGDPLHGELRHAKVLGHRHRRPLLGVLVPLQKELLRRLRNCGAMGSLIVKSKWARSLWDMQGAASGLSQGFVR